MAGEGLLYTKEHEWAKVDGKKVTVGVSDYAQQQMGELVFVELPAVGKEFSQGDEIATVESSKAANEVYSPVTGKVTAVNGELESKPELINEDCYGAGWICKMEITDAGSVKGLMDSKKYDDFVKGL